MVSAPPSLFECFASSLKASASAKPLQRARTPRPEKSIDAQLCGLLSRGTRQTLQVFDSGVEQTTKLPSRSNHAESHPIVTAPEGSSLSS